MYEIVVASPTRLVLDLVLMVARFFSFFSDSCALLRWIR
jgi:hypothetical protein